MGPPALGDGDVPPHPGPVAVAHTVVLTADLLFGSSVQAMLAHAGHEVELAAGPGAAREALSRRAPGTLIVDLTDHELGGVSVVAALRRDGLLEGVPVLGYYSHVEPTVRDAAAAEGFDLVVPRSRMAREGAALVNSLTTT